MCRDFVTMRVRVDSGTRETYKAIKGMDAFDKVRENIASYDRKFPMVEAKYILLKENLENHEKEGFIQHCAKAGVKNMMISGETHSYLPGMEDSLHTAYLDSARRLYSLG